jgi:hypothetical protein
MTGQPASSGATRSYLWTAAAPVATAVWLSGGLFRFGSGMCPTPRDASDFEVELCAMFDRVALRQAAFYGTSATSSALPPAPGCLACRYNYSALSSQFGWQTVKRGNAAEGLGTPLRSATGAAGALPARRG